jgi:hypothetical protein
MDIFAVLYLLSFYLPCVHRLKWISLRCFISCFLICLVCAILNGYLCGALSFVFFYLPHVHHLGCRGAQCARTSQAGQSRTTVAVPVPFQSNSTVQTDGGRDSLNPSNTIECTAVNGSRRLDGCHSGVFKPIFGMPHCSQCLHMNFA